MINAELISLCNKIGYEFKKGALLQLAMTHPSYAHEHGQGVGYDNQRLEFLGDAILDFVIGEALYEAHPEYAEGELSRVRSRLVCEEALSILARQLGFESVILMGRGEKKSAGEQRPGTLADAYEALIGAIYLDGGMDAARAFVLRFHEPLLADPDGNWLVADAKSRLQEWAQSEHHAVRYEVVSQEGPGHCPQFVVDVFVDDARMGSGRGHSKKEAQQAAALAALSQVKRS